MDLDTRFLVMTFNIWAEDRWPEREPSLRKLLQLRCPDILGVQELRPVTRQVIDEVLPGHARVDDSFEGWEREGNIWWNRSIFDMQTYGAYDIGMLEPKRRLFWVRLAFRHLEGRTIVIANAHYTWAGNRIEREGGLSPRPPQAKKTLEALHEIVRPDEPVVFMGDLNDARHPIWLLREGGLKDSFQALGTAPRPTHPSTPTGVPQVLDWQLHRGPIHPMANEVVDFSVNGIAPSDHKPLVVTYRLAEPNEAASC